MTSKLKLAVGLAVGAALAAGLAGRAGRGADPEGGVQDLHRGRASVPVGAGRRSAGPTSSRRRAAADQHEGLSGLVAGRRRPDRANSSRMRQGMIDMAVGSTINWSPQVKEMNLFSMPFLMPDYKAIDALTQGEVGKELFKIIGDKRRGAAGLGRERLPRAHQLQARHAHARRPQGHEDPRGRLAASSPTSSPRSAPTPRR